jgi:glycyl-tRNA synthetase beta chain
MDEPVPRTVEGAVLSIADKADSIAGMFALGLQPTGSKDPFALRRQANGIIKTLAEHRLPIAISKVFEAASTAYRSAGIVYRGEPGHSEGMRESVDIGLHVPTMSTPALVERIVNFMRERLEYYLREVCGYPYDVVNAVMAVGGHAFRISMSSRGHYETGGIALSYEHVGTEPTIPDAEEDVPLTLERAQAINEAKSWDDFRSIVIAFKRTKNILLQAAEKGFEIGPFDNLASSPDELLLYHIIDETGAGFAQDVKNRRFLEALRKMARLRPQIDAYFDNVMVMVDDADTRRSRLGFLYVLYYLFSGIADISEIVTEG